MPKPRPRHPDPSARRAKQAVESAIRRSKSRLDSEYPQLELHPPNIGGGRPTRAR